jgi:integrase/recombinase XerD
MTDSFHYLPYKQLVAKYLASGGDPGNVDLIHEYLAELSGTRGLAESTRDTLTLRLLAWLEYLPAGFRAATAGDLYVAISEAREDWMHNTHCSRVANLKAFYLWLAENEYTKIPVARIERIQPPKPHLINKGADDLYTPDEIRQLIEACRSSRDRALIATLYESGLRSHEIARLTWGAVTLDERGAVISLDAASSRKGSRARYIRLVMAREYIAAWKRDYPGSPAGAALVFVSKNHRPLSYTTLRAAVRRNIARAGLGKPGGLHLFRHSRITHLLQQGVPESVVKMMMWGSISSQMLSAYAHLVNTDTDREILRISGIEDPEAAPAPRLNPIQCARCATICGPTSPFCPECGLPLTEQAIVDMETALAVIREKDPELKQIIERGKQIKGNFHL